MKKYKIIKLLLPIMFICAISGCDDSITEEEYLPPIENKGLADTNILYDMAKLKKPVSFSAKNGTIFNWEIFDSTGNSIYKDDSNKKDIQYTFDKSGEYKIVLSSNSNVGTSVGIINIPENNDKISYCIDLGLNHSIIADKTSDNLYIYGDNTYNKLCINKDEFSNIEIPGLLLSYRDLNSVAAGDNHTIFVSNHRLWGCGDNTYGQLGVGENYTKSDNETVTLIKTLRYGPSVTQYVAAGGNISSVIEIFIGSSLVSRVQVWGGEKSDEEPTFYPRELITVAPRQSPLQAVGRNFFLYRATMSYNMFSGGWNNKGQMGRVSYRPTAGYSTMWNPDLPENIEREDSWNYTPNTAYIYAPYGEEYDKEYENVSGGIPNISYFANNSNEARLVAGDYFSMAVKRYSSSVDTWDVLYVWGDNSEGQLGLEVKNKENIIRRPAPLFNNNADNDKRYSESMSDYAVYNPIRATIKEIAAGRAHGLAVDDKGILYGWGASDKGQLTDSEDFNKTNDNVRTIKHPSNAKWLNVWAGGDRTIALSDDYNLYTWGDNRDGILGVESSEEIVNKPTKLMFELRPYEEVEDTGTIN